MDSGSTAAIESVAAAINRLADAVLALGVGSGGAGSDEASSSKQSKRRPDAAVKISDELAAFIGVDAAEPITRQDATGMVMKYVKENALQDKEDRRKIVPNADLAKILRDGAAVINVLTLKSALKDHFSAIEA